MIREYLFHGKRIDNGEWVEGFYLVKTDPLLGTQKHFIVHQDITPNGFLNSMISWYVVDPNTVGQFTGQTDKNGKRIFEGDICRIGNLIYKVEFKYSCWWFTILSSKVYCCPAFSSHCGDLCEVIGNTTDNPEILEVKYE